MIYCTRSFHEARALRARGVTSRVSFCSSFTSESPPPPRFPWQQVVEHADEIESPPAGSVQEAFWYMVREGGLWESLEGASEWVADFLLQ